MSTMMNKMQDAFNRQGNNLGSLLKLAPAAMQEMARLKANGNKLGFTKDPNGRWYADLKSWPMDRSHLEMVAGADKLLDELAEGKNYVTLKLAQHTKPVKVGKGEALLTLTSKSDNGLSGTYYVSEAFNTRVVWLCPVINFVFMRVPKYITFSKLA